MLRNTAWSPPYCPLYSFHASDMFPWLRPRTTAAFDYTFTPTDVAYSELIRRQFGAVVNGTSPPGWRSVGGATMRDALPSGFASAELRLPDAGARTDKAAACAIWLGSGWYERIGLVN